MNRKIMLALGLLALVVLLGAFATPARAADTYEITVNNKNTFTITLTFVGLDVMQFDLAPGKSTIELERGTYTHSYYGCGQLNFGTFTVKLKDNFITIENCNAPASGAPPAGTELFYVDNKTATTFPVIFIGLESNKDYEYTVAPGNNRLYLVEGKYAYSYYACSELHYGTTNVTARDEVLTILDCSSSANGDAISNTLSTFKVKNNTGESIVLVLYGYLDYLFAISSTGSYQTVEIGYYEYKLWACGTVYDGVIQVTGQGDQLLKTPYCSPAPPAD